LTFVVSSNLYRRHLTASQRATVVVEIEPLLAEEAKKHAEEGRRKNGQTAGRGRPKADSSTEKVRESNPRERHARESANKAAKLTGTNRQYP
jgi:hypothetical protein